MYCKRLLIWFMTFCFLLCLWPIKEETNNVEASSPIWNGTIDRSWYYPGNTLFTLNTAEQLAGFIDLISTSVNFSGVTIQLGRDIVLNDISNLDNWLTQPPANNWRPSSREFAGTFDGRGYTVIGMYLNRGYTYEGFFGWITTTGVVRNLGIISSYVAGGGINATGGIAGDNFGLMENCFFKGYVKGTTSVGGVVGRNFGTLKYTRNTATVYGSGRFVGGVVGINYEAGSLTDCYNKGSVSGTKEVGGVVGENDGGKLRNCYNMSNISSLDSAGGVVGINALPAAQIINCYNVGSVYGYYGAGGIAYINSYQANISNCHNIGSLSAAYLHKSIGPIAAINSSTSTISNCYSLSTYSDGSLKTSAQFMSGEVSWLLNTAGDTQASTKAWALGIPSDYTPNESMPGVIPIPVRTDNRDFSPIVRMFLQDNEGVRHAKYAKAFGEILPNMDKISGYKCIGYTLSADGSGTVYAIGSEYRGIEEGTVLYAKYVQKTYTIVIPESISANTNGSFNVIASSITNFESRDSINVYVNSYNGFRLKRSSSDYLGLVYSLQSSGQTITNGGKVCEFTANGYRTVLYTITGNASYAGIYKDTLTFTVSLNEG